MGCLCLLQLVICICLKLFVTQSQNVIFQPLKHDATIVGVASFYNQTTFSITECYLTCLRETDKCYFVEVANVNEAWSCKLFHFIQDITKYLKPLKGSEISAVPNKFPRDCVELKSFGYKDGVYTIQNKKGSSIKVFCDMTTDGGGWIVLQRRFDGSVDFNRDWNSYRDGFGDVKGEHWLGNEFIHQYTSAYSTEMMAEAIAFDDTKASSKMQNFKLSNEASEYIFEYDTCDGLCVDWLQKSKGEKFSTFDNENDKNQAENCAVAFPGGWWFSNCYLIFFNGRYSAVQPVDVRTGIRWVEFRGYYEVLKKTTMLMRRIQKN